MGPAGVRAIASTALLEDDLRRSLYLFVRKHGPVTRAQAAAYAGISRKLAAFHLDKLVARGLLRVGGSNGGPRRNGRPPKLYEPETESAIEVSLPQRRHDLLAGVLAEAVESASAAETAKAAALRLARARGAVLGDGLRTQLNLHRPAPGRSVKLAQAVLDRQGFEPVIAGPTRVLLRNCPFAPVAGSNPDVVCRMAHAFVDGLLKGLGSSGAQCVIEPAEGRCCVVLEVDGQPTSRSTPSGTNAMRASSQSPR